MFGAIFLLYLIPAVAASSKAPLSSVKLYPPIRSTLSLFEQHLVGAISGAIGAITIGAATGAGIYCCASCTCAT